MSGSTLAVIDIASDHSVALVHTGGAGHVDLLDYDSTHRRLFVANRLDRLLTWIDADSNEIIGRVEGLGSGLEQPRYNPADGLVYLTDNKDNVLFQIDPESACLVETFAIQDECFPNGMAINAKNNQALLVSSYTARPHTVIWDLNTQKIASITEESGCGDGAVYVPSVDLIFKAASEFGDGPVIGVFGGDPVRFLTNVAATPGVSWVDYDTAILPEVVSAVAGRAEVFIDGGLRRGTDVVKALALGASACLIGRPYMFGLAAGGEDGARRILEIFRNEIDHTMALTGCATVADISPSLVTT